jgi:ribonuclease BN (tRNA processing enzyme)
MAGRAGRESHAKQLALFHIPPPNEYREEEFRSDAAKAFGKDVVIGTDMATIET